MGFDNINQGDPVHVVAGEYAKIPKVYIAGKLNAMAPEYIQNVKRMIDWGEEVRQLNMAVFIPGIDFTVGMMKEWDYSDYFDNSQPWLLASDAMFLTPGWETSKGTAREIEYATQAGIPIFEDLDDLYMHFYSPTQTLKEIKEQVNCRNCEDKCNCDTEEQQYNPSSEPVIQKSEAEAKKEEGKKYLDGARKDDNGKLRYDLVPTYALEGIAQVMTYGASKYGDNNWQGVRPADRYFAAAQRHLMDIRKGEHVDPESGLMHMDHAITSLMMYRELLYNTDKHVQVGQK